MTLKVIHINEEKNQQGAASTIVSTDFVVIVDKVLSRSE